jgi:hypothetical protein
LLIVLVEVRGLAVVGRVGWSLFSAPSEERALAHYGDARFLFPSGSSLA